MRATLISRSRMVLADGGLIDVVIWRVPEPVPQTTHGFKYRAVYVHRGVRVVGFDNERGKGDHCHIGGRERPYVFTTVEQLEQDFVAAIDLARSAQ